MSSSWTSRQQLKVGTVFFHRQFECHDGSIKDRYFVVVRIDSSAFYCFTASTQEYLRTPVFASEVSCLIKRGTTCLPKDCVIDCRFIEKFDDILMSNRLNTNNACVHGQLPPYLLQSIHDAVSTSRLLEKKKKRPILESLGRMLQRPS